jgi:hypothetical protein
VPKQVSGRKSAPKKAQRLSVFAAAMGPRRMGPLGAASKLTGGSLQQLSACGGVPWGLCRIGLVSRRGRCRGAGRRQEARARGSRDLTSPHCPKSSAASLSALASLADRIRHALDSGRYLRRLADSRTERRSLLLKYQFPHRVALLYAPFTSSHQAISGSLLARPMPGPFFWHPSRNVKSHPVSFEGFQKSLVDLVGRHASCFSFALAIFLHVSSHAVRRRDC